MNEVFGSQRERRRMELQSVNFASVMQTSTHCIT